MKASILVVDDEAVARQSLTDILKLEGHNVASAPNGLAAADHIRTHAVDLAVVDLRMPGMDGMELVHAIEQISPETEIIMLTAHGTTESAIESLRMRIHDYVLKPASPQQIVASVRRGLARRTARLRARAGHAASPESVEAPEVFSLGDGLTVDLARREIRQKSKVETLTPAEGRLLRIFVENPGKVFTHRELVMYVQGYDTSRDEAPEVLRPLVSRLRKKLETFPAFAARLRSVRGTGYVYGEE